MATPSFDLNDLKRRMQGAVAVAASTTSAACAPGAPSPSLLEPIQVDAYGADACRMNQVATVSVPEPRLLSVQVWDRGMVGAVEKAIRESDLGLNPQTEGQVIRLRIPELNEQRRKEMVKVAHKYAEEARVAVRHVRRDGMDLLKKLEKDGDHQRGRREAPVRPRSRRRPTQTIAEIDDAAGREGKGNHAGLRSRPLDGARRHGRPNPRLSSPADGSDAGRRAGSRPGAMSPSSWTATAAGPRARGLPRLEGHRRGVEAVRRAVRAADRARHRATSRIYSFSSENWRRPADEVADLMGLLKRFIRNDLAELHAQQRPRARHRRARRARRRHPRRCSTRPRTLTRAQHRPDARRRLQLRRPAGDRRAPCARSPRQVAGRRARAGRRSTPSALDGRARHARHPRSRPRHPHLAASSGCRTSCSGRRPTPSSSSCPTSGPISTTRAFRGGARRVSAAATAASAA